MADPSADPDAPDPFSSPSSAPNGPEAPPWASDPEASGPDMSSASFAADVARMWVQRNQKATMLGAFAVGVFVGAMLRE